MFAQLRTVAVGLLLQVVLLVGPSHVQGDLTGDEIFGELRLAIDNFQSDYMIFNAATVGAQVEFFSTPIPNGAGTSFLEISVDVMPLVGGDFAVWVEYHYEGELFDPGLHFLWFKDLEWLDKPGAISGVTPDESTSLFTLANVFDSEDGVSGLYLAISGAPLLVEPETGQEVVGSLHYEVQTVHVPEPPIYAVLGGFLLVVSCFRKQKTK